MSLVKAYPVSILINQHSNKALKNGYFLADTYPFSRFLFYANFSNIRRQNGSTWRETIDVSRFRVFYPVTRTCLRLIFSNEIFSDTCCSISKNANLISGLGLKCCLGSVISTDKSQCFAKFWLGSVFEYLSRKSKLLQYTIFFLLKPRYLDSTWGPTDVTSLCTDITTAGCFVPTSCSES